MPGTDDYHWSRVIRFLTVLIYLCSAMERAYLTFLLFLLISPVASAQVDTGFTWVRPSPTGELLHEVENVGPRTFVAVSNNGFLLHTSDAGVSWSRFGTELARCQHNLYSFTAKQRQ